MRKPQQAAAMSDGQWSSFAQEMGRIVRRFKKDGFAMYALLMILIGVVVLLLNLLSGNPIGGVLGNIIRKRPRL